MSTLPKILVVEDEENVCNFFHSQLDGKANLLATDDLERANLLFNANTDVALVVMDACVPGRRPNAFWLVIEMRHSGFVGPIIAISSSPEYRALMMEAGCSYECEKNDLPMKVCQLLNLAS